MEAQTPYLRLLAPGSNARGQLSNGSDDDSHTFRECRFISCIEGTLLPNTLGILQFAIGANRTLALLEFRDGRRELWGTHPNKTYASQRYARCLIATAQEMPYLVLKSPSRLDVVISIGSNDFGVLGIGTRRAMATPAVILFDHLTIEGRFINPSELIVESIVARPRHVVLHVRTVLNNEHALIGWDLARHSQLGDTKIVNYDGPHIVSLNIPLHRCRYVLSVSNTP
ncbi:uncharacterized protein BJ212DRAFT_1477432 [Suillus subaureus]|uniref:Uncharacterized protein n=1 Tax=Suillus subaureus TaxID=48587 RepID=A0A9P7EHW2_9AGAM|nr:uncharacterized protein BJ212DRAFT_1477432 [Suillus subaureus]KAG1821552.1 hypothetical protein BJ212DRAFT_1477432 [Suillus subaureus]